MLELMIWILYGGVIYTSFFLLLLMLEQRNIKEEVRWRDEWPEVGLIIPVYNEEDTVGMTIESLMDVEYPDDKLEIVVVNDGSEDDTREIAEQYTDEEKITLVNQENQGKGAALNRGLEKINKELVGCVDADSKLSEDALKNIISELDEEEAGIASAMKVYNPQNLIQRLQWLEYFVGIFNRKLMGLIDSVYVTPGPLSIYRRESVEELGGFDEESRVEDQEICVRLQKHHYKVGYSREGEVYTVAPDTLRKFYNQRYRWYRGSLETIIQYREMFLNSDYGDFGMFGMPSKLVNSLLSVMGLLLMSYTILNPLIQSLETFWVLGPDAVEFAFPEISELSSKLMWALIGQDFMVLTLIASLVGYSLLLVFMASEYTEENIMEAGVLAAAIYLFWYFLLIGSIWLKVVVDMVTGREKGW